MRAPALALAITILGHGAAAEPESDAITWLKACFQLDRTARADRLERLSKEFADETP